MEFYITYSLELPNLYIKLPRGLFHATRTWNRGRRFQRPQSVLTTLFQFFQVIIEKFGETPEPEFPGHVILEQYQVKCFKLLFNKM